MSLPHEVELRIPLQLGDIFDRWCLILGVIRHDTRLLHPTRRESGLAGSVLRKFSIECCAPRKGVDQAWTAPVISACMYIS